MSLYRRIYLVKHCAYSTKLSTRIVTSYEETECDIIRNTLCVIAQIKLAEIEKNQMKLSEH